jgi:hypothetical protein
MSLAHEIVKRLGGDWCGAYGLVPGAGHSKRDRSLSVRQNPDDAEDVILHSFAGEDWKGIKDEWRAHGIMPAKDFRCVSAPIPNPARKAAAKAEGEKSEAARLETALYLWDCSQPAGHTVVETYLRSRGIEVGSLPATVRYLPPSPPKHPFPAMIAAFGIPDEPEPGVLAMPRLAIRGVHITLLAADGKGKAAVEKQKRMLARSLGSPIVLAPANDGCGLLLGEGIETVLSGHLASGLGAWAAGASTRFLALADAVPDYVDTVMIAQEDDADGAGERGTSELADRLIARGFEVLIAEASSEL